MKVVDEVKRWEDLANKYNSTVKGVKLVNGKPVPMTEEEWLKEIRDMGTRLQ